MIWIYYILDSSSSSDIVLHWRDQPDAAPIDVRANLTLPEFNVTRGDLGDCTTDYIVLNGTGTEKSMYCSY